MKVVEGQTPYDSPSTNTTGFCLGLILKCDSLGLFLGWTSGSTCDANQ